MVPLLGIGTICIRTQGAGAYVDNPDQRLLHLIFRSKKSPVIFTSICTKKKLEIGLKWKYALFSGVTGKGDKFSTVLRKSLQKYRNKWETGQQVGIWKTKARKEESELLWPSGSTWRLPLESRKRLNGKRWEKVESRKRETWRDPQ